MTTRYIATGHAHVPDSVGLSTLRQPAHTVARLRGDLDAATAPALRERLAALLQLRTRLLILDLSEVGFCDAAGLAVLIGTQWRATPLGIALRLAAPAPRSPRCYTPPGSTALLASTPRWPARSPNPSPGTPPQPAQDSRIQHHHGAGAGMALLDSATWSAVTVVS